MKQIQLEPILWEGEGALIEFKQSFSPSIIKDIVAFSTTAGFSKRISMLHSLPMELSACYARWRAGNANERRYFN